MKMLTVAKYFATALLLGGLGFVGAIGTLTLLFGPNAGTYAPANSSDAAAWIQAVGSIGAIIGAFFLGARQSKDARKLALDMERQRRTEQRERYKQTVGLITLVAQSTLNTLGRLDEFEPFRRAWQQVIRHDIQTAFAAFSAIPAHELGDKKQIYGAFAVRAATQNLVDDILAVMQAPALVQAQYTHLRTALLPDHHDAIYGASAAFDAEWRKTD